MVAPLWPSASTAYRSHHHHACYFIQQLCTCLSRDNYCFHLFHVSSSSYFFLFTGISFKHQLCPRSLHPPVPCGQTAAFPSTKNHFLHAWSHCSHFENKPDNSECEDHSEQSELISICAQSNQDLSAKGFDFCSLPPDFPLLNTRQVTASRAHAHLAPLTRAFPDLSSTMLLFKHF